ncbi:thiouridylase [Thermosipho sp. 1063]|uniref:tRNA 2-thiouridine(34) synthase MnmA n=1 Tax=unclassified Thermosipho (in: thermotogales) TaxID=2676525 RepID=UPI00094938EF|nr:MULTISPECIES: tRNA 2-thiouridine(34) synthase MnmA [unclassified Thermosipho (in: thermotogales)]ANQ54411.1 thiouridylase [Thermosipho sp. 1070]APT72855.1 thiouridylase [Thermosipho sp. 1063]OOC42290.1 thiouridylase [Thermosipho sp. 1074]
MKVGVALSGGVDSAVALYLLKQKGYDVTAYHIKTIPDSVYLTKEIKHKVCCSPSDTFDAMKVAKKFDVEMKIVHVEDVFKETIVKYFLDEYRKGRTPNPCFFCNDWIKFGFLLDEILEDGNDYVASGHYAIVKNGKLYKAKSKEKDQSYFLASIKRGKLGHLLFPNGEYEKEEIREIAKKLDIHVHSKEDSQDLCFIPDNDIYNFLSENGVNFNPGLIIDTKGNILGTHKGLPNYTIGQRKIGIATGKRLYVLKKDFENNLLIVGEKDEVFNKKFTVSKLNFLQDVSNSLLGYVKVRKKFKEVKCKAYFLDGRLFVKTEEPVFAITPGQIAVIYDDDGAVVVSGIIEEEGWNGFKGFD